MGLGRPAARAIGQLQGILNGIDIDVWDPAATATFADRFSRTIFTAALPTRWRCNGRFGLQPDNEAILLGVISRLSWQKGLDLLIECVPALLQEGSADSPCSGAGMPNSNAVPGGGGKPIRIGSAC